MAAQLVSYYLRRDIKDMTPGQISEIAPRQTRIGTQDPVRAINEVVNQIKRTGAIKSKSEIKFLESRLVP